MVRARALLLVLGLGGVLVSRVACLPPASVWQVLAAAPRWNGASLVSQSPATPRAARPLAFRGADSGEQVCAPAGSLRSRRGLPCAVLAAVAVLVSEYHVSRRGDPLYEEAKKGKTVGAAYGATVVAGSGGAAAAPCVSASLAGVHPSCGISGEFMQRGISCNGVMTFQSITKHCCGR